jgi:hypothetical protein
MEDRDCVVCSEHVGSSSGFRDLDAGGYFLFGFCDEEAPIKLWIHYRCLRKVEASSSASE